MTIPIALNDIRAAILHSRRMSFIHEHQRMVADFYLLGQAKKSGAYVILAWCHEPAEGWQLLRYSLLRDLEAVGHIDQLRRDFDPYHPKISFIDTQAFHVPRPHH